MNEKFYQVNSKTGEVTDGFIAYVVPKRQNGFGKDWFAMAQNAALLFAKSNLTGDDFRVLMRLFGQLDFENLLVVNQAEIARELDMHRQHVQRSIKRLIKLDALLEGPKIGINRSYRLNPRFGWKGSAKNHRKALHDDLKARMKSAGIRGVIENDQMQDKQIDMEDWIAEHQD